MTISGTHVTDCVTCSRKGLFYQHEILPVGGYFRLIARRLLNGLQFFRGIWFVPALIGLAPQALMLMLLDGLDRVCAFTLGYICTAQKADRS